MNFAKEAARAHVRGGGSRGSISGMMLPADWLEVANPNATGPHDAVYFANPVTKESCWTHPSLQAPAGQPDPHQQPMAADPRGRLAKQESFFGANRVEVTRAASGGHRSIEAKAAQALASASEHRRVLHARAEAQGEAQRERASSAAREAIAQAAARREVEAPLSAMEEQVRRRREEERERERENHGEGEQNPLWCR